MSIEDFYIEVEIRKKKWVLVCAYDPNKNLISSCLKDIGNTAWTVIPQSMATSFSLMILVWRRQNQ